VLILGTGGVSIWALQLAKAAGLRSIITSSSDAKLERAKTLGATETINYRTNREWQQVVQRLTNGRGVDLVLEVGGTETLSRSINSARMGGSVAIIGGVSGFGGEFQPFSLIGGARKLLGVLVGSRTDLEQLTRFVDLAAIQPVVDRVFPFDEAIQAYEYLESGRHSSGLAAAATVAALSRVDQLSPVTDQDAIKKAKETFADRMLIEVGPGN
jgi:NADPH:quinone reductase-like Zn-dependent oxidoreductase